MKKVLALILSLAMVMSMVVGCGSTAEAPAEEPAAEEAVEETAEAPAEEAAEEPAADFNPKVAMIYNSAVKDGGWNETADEKMHELAEQYGLEVSYQEKVDDTIILDTLRNYASSGYGLIVDNEQYHCEQIAEVCQEFPDVKFACCNGYLGKADNFWAITGDMWQHIYLAGVAAGSVTKSNKIGLITFSTDSDSALTMKAALTGGVAMANPDAEVIHVATGSFSDLEAGKEMAQSLLDQGCDVILCNSGDCNGTVCQFCIDNEIYAISAIVDRNDMDDTYMLGSAMMPPTAMLDAFVTAYVNGEFVGADAPDVKGIESGVEEWRLNPALADTIGKDIAENIEKATAGILDGSITVELPSAK